MVQKTSVELVADERRNIWIVAVRLPPQTEPGNADR